MDRFDTENSYSTIMKRLSAFGGVQLFNILITLVRGKFVAMFLGPEGMGISSLFTSSTATVQHLSSLGLNLAIVKEVARVRDDSRGRSDVIGVALRLLLLTSLLGAVMCAVLSPWLSKWCFGDYSYTLSFVWLGLFSALSIGGGGLLAILQGLSQVKRLAKASLTGGLSGLLIGVPLYYFFGTGGIVPAMILMSGVIFTFYYVSLRRSVEYEYTPLSLRQHVPLIRRLVVTGLILMAGGLAGTVANFAINAFVRAYGDIDNVGLYQAASSLTNQYLGIVFSALAMDYFPRLSAAMNEHGKMLTVVNRQTEIVMLIATPLALALIWSAPWVIKLLLTDEFFVIIPLMRWLGMGILLQAVVFPLGYILLAGNNRRVYVWVEIVIDNLTWIALSMGLYYMYGLIGLGVSMMARSMINIGVAYGVTRSYYGFRYDRRSLTALAVCLTLGGCGFLLSLTTDAAFGWPILAVMLVSAVYSALRLRQRLASRQA